jgi:hypothetical protein
MAGYRQDRQHPPDPRRVSNVAITRYEHIYEVDPALMQEHVTQQSMPAWDFHRIVDNRSAYLAWMQDHFADSIVSGGELLREIEAES